MVMQGVVDTDILIDLLRQEPKAIQWASTMSKIRLGVASIAWMEVVQGATDTTKRSQAIRFLKRFPVVHFETPDSFWAMHQLAHYYLSHGIQITDTIIAAGAVRLQIPLYTRNVKHYQMLPGLQLIRPYS